MLTKYNGISINFMKDIRNHTPSYGIPDLCDIIVAEPFIIFSTLQLRIVYYITYLLLHQFICQIAIKSTFISILRVNGINIPFCFAHFQLKYF